MTAREPVLLVVLVETAQLRWYVAGIGLDGEALPLMCSEPGNLDPYLGLPLDEQISFLRHRFSGVLQRGCDRLWGRQKKPCQIVFVTDGPFIQAEPELTRRVAEHFVVWMTNPPVVVFVSRRGFHPGEPHALELVTGDIDAPFRKTLESGLPRLAAAMQKSEAWELAPTKKAL